MTTYAAILEESTKKLAYQRQQTSLALTAPLATRAAGGYGGGYSSGGGGMSPSALAPNSGGFGSSYRQMAAHSEQLAHYRGWVYAAIRPVATRIAGQSIKVGVQRVSGTSNSRTPAAGSTGSSSQPGKMSAKAYMALKTAPPLLRKRLIAEGVEPLESHPLIEAVENPNPIMVQHQLAMFTVACLMLAAKCYWWLTSTTDEAAGEETLQIWPLPPNWVEPKYGGPNLIAAWFVTPRGASEPIEVPFDEICYFSTPDPADPLGSKSPLQAAAASVTIDEKIERSQLQSYDSPKPGVILTAGRLPGPPGNEANGMRPVLTPAQRKQLITSIMNVWGGVENHGLPAIVDGLIESITPWSRTAEEMDYVNGEKAKAARIFQMFGVNPISAGLVEGANRASAVVADQHLCANVVNPLITLVSQVMTKRIAPRYSRPGMKVYIWIEECSPKDEEMQIQKARMLMGTGATYGKPSITQNQLLEMCGLPPIEGGDELPDYQPPTPAPGGAFGAASRPTRTPAAGSGGSSGKPKPRGGKSIDEMIDDLGCKYEVG